MQKKAISLEDQYVLKLNFIIIFSIIMAVFTGEQRVPNPIVGYYAWKSNDEKWEIYNKETKEKTQVEKLPPFIVLRQGWSATGYNADTNKAIWSNEVEKTSEIFKVRTGDVNIAEGVWKDIKPAVEAMGGKIQIVLTVLMEDKVYGITLKGASIGPVLVGFKGNSINSNMFQFDGFTQEQTGAVKYTVPVLKKLGAIENIEDAKHASKIVQDYFNQRNGTPIEESVGSAEAFDDFVSETKGDVDSDLPF